jgi:1-acyl-sn-glycerol-3-phosphate acyltransferase
VIRDIVWCCLVCKTVDGLDAKGVCRSCGAVYRRGVGGSIQVEDNSASASARSYTAREVTALMPDPGISGTAHCTVRESAGDKKVYALGRYLGRVEMLDAPRPGKITLENERLRFDADVGKSFDISVLDITAIQPSSHALQIKTVRNPVFSVKFTDSSPKMWEERLQNAINAASVRTGRGEVVEFQPRVCTKRIVSCDATRSRARQLVQRGMGKRPKAPWQYKLAAWLARNIWKYLGGGVEVVGLENIPDTGPYLILPNHESYLETMLVPAVIPERPTWAMAKSTQFTVPVFGWMMAQIYAYPVRRFEIDPQTMRFTLRLFSEGFGIVIYVEGERTWDGDLQPARLGVARMALQTGVPVIPCRVEGAFDAWPRWSGTPQRRGVKITFLPPLKLPAAASRAACEQHLESTVAVIRDAIRGESG